MKLITGSWPSVPFGMLELALNQFSVIRVGCGRAPRLIRVPLDSTGTIHTTEIWGNDELEPRGSSYRVTVFDQHGHVFCPPQNIQITTTPFDVAAALVCWGAMPPGTQFVGGMVGGAFNTQGLFIGAGSNISLSSAVGAQGLSIWIHGMYGGTGTGTSSSASWTLGMPNGPVITDYSLSLVPGSNISLSIQP